MNSIRQFVAILRMNVAGLGQRLGPMLTIVIGITCAVGVLVAMLAMGAGARQQVMGDARDDRIVLTSVGAQSTGQSNVSKDEARAVLDIPGLRKSANDQPIALFVVIVIMEAQKNVGGTRVNFPLLGVSGNLVDVRPELHVTAGRMYRPGLHELISNDTCIRQYTGFDIGDKRHIRGTDWTVVGHFVQGHSASTCLVYADGDSVLSAFGRGSYNTVTAMLDSATGFDAYRAAVNANPALRIDVMHEKDAMARELKQVNGILNFVSYFVGAIMAIGATLGAVNSLYAIVDSRRRELATLRAIGFSSGPIVTSIVAESILLAIPGALLGSGLAWLFFNGLSASPFGFTFQLAVTPSLVVLGITWALVMGLIGSLLPAVRAARVSVTTALRAT